MDENLRDKLNKLVKMVLVGCFLLIFTSNISLAKDEDKNVGNAVGFNYKIIYPENQVEGENGYFDLELKPGSEQVVDIDLINNGKEDVKVDLSLNGTKTNSNGVLEYGPTDIKNDASLKHPFEDIVSAPESVEVPAGGTKTIPIKIKMPKEAFDGIVLGGIHMKKADVKEEAKEKGATVKNTYSYVVAIKLQNNLKKVKPELKINSAKASQRNYRNSVSINISNVTGSLVKDNFDIDTQITKKGSKDVLYERKQTGMSFAPNSQIDYYVSMGGEKMIPGDYTAHVVASIGEEKWEKSLDFTITKEEADEYNKRDVDIVQDKGLDWKIVMLIVIGVLAVVIIIFIFVKISKKKKSQKKSSKRTSRNNKAKK